MRLAVQLVARAAVELEVARAGGDVGARLLERLAAVARFDQRELARVVQRSPRESATAARPFSAGASAAPAPSNARVRAARPRASMSAASPRAIAAKARPSDGSIIGSVAPAARRDPAIGDEMLGGW